VPYESHDEYNHADIDVKHEGGHAYEEDAPEPCTTPANFAAWVTTTLKPEDFGDTEMWRYLNGATPPPAVSRALPIKTASLTVA
jgi:hypothetical protein